MRNAGNPLNNIHPGAISGASVGHSAYDQHLNSLSSADYHPLMSSMTQFPPLAPAQSFASSSRTNQAKTSYIQNGRTYADAAKSALAHPMQTVASSSPMMTSPPVAYHPIPQMVAVQSPPQQFIMVPQVSQVAVPIVPVTFAPVQTHVAMQQIPSMMPNNYAPVQSHPAMQTLNNGHVAQMYPMMKSNMAHPRTDVDTKTAKLSPRLQEMVVKEALRLNQAAAAANNFAQVATPTYDPYGHPAAHSFSPYPSNGGMSSGMTMAQQPIASH